MGFFFRKSASFGPFRLNLSKSGVGASFGVKGARLTVTPRGTTYITVGSHGFYYRETISNRKAINENRLPAPPPVPSASPASDEIRTADVADLLDSSSEVLVGRLNERAAMFNPAWLLYLAALVAVFVGISLQESTSQTPGPPADHPLSYASLVARYGYPNSVLESSTLGMVSVRTASYAAAKVGVIFVPEECTESYQKAVEVLREQSVAPTIAKQDMSELRPCSGQPDTNWIAVGYVDAGGQSGFSYDTAKLHLDGITGKQDSPPVIDFKTNSARKNAKASSRVAKQRTSAKEVWAAPAGVLAQIRADNEREVSAHNTQVYSSYLLMIGGVFVFVFGIVIHKKNTEKRSTRLFYELNETEGQKYAVVQQAVNHLSKAHQVWRIQARSPTWNWKRNAGASSLVQRVSSHISYANPPRVESNVKVPSVALGGPTLYFMPDLLLYWENGRFGAISYEDFQVQQNSTRFIEDGFVPADATRVGTTWRYVRVDGGPDRRFNNNAQLPILQYGTLAFQSSRGLNIYLQTSTVEASAAFVNCWLDLRNRKSKIEGRQTTTENGWDVASDSKARARKVLGVSDTATSDEISAAYRRLAQMYHPDKVAGLAPEFQMLADQRMKEINVAYESLKNHNKNGA